MATMSTKGSNFYRVILKINALNKMKMVWFMAYSQLFLKKYLKSFTTKCLIWANRKFQVPRLQIFNLRRYIIKLFSIALTKAWISFGLTSWYVQINSCRWASLSLDILLKSVNILFHFWGEHPRSFWQDPIQGFEVVFYSLWNNRRQVL